MKELNDFINATEIIGIAIIILVIALIVAIFEIKTNTSNTSQELKELNRKEEYICQALNYIINNDGNFRADKPQYIPEQKKQITWDDICNGNLK